MSYEIVLGNRGPLFTVTLTTNDGVFELTASDTVVMRYADPDGETHEVSMEIVGASTGELQYAWVEGDLPVAGAYKGLITVTRPNDNTFPRTFPSNGSKIIWWVYPSI